MSQVTLFISAVSSEFAEDPTRAPERVRGPGDYRTYLRDKLTGPDVSVKVQEDFIAGGVLTLDKLVLYLQECDAVIHLVGDMTGAVASDIAVESLFESAPQLPRKIPFLATPADAAALGVSYTQWEGYLALLYGKRLLVCAAEPHAPRAERHVLVEEQRRSQDAHLARLKELERYAEIVFASREELVIEVLRTLRTVLPPAKRESLPAAPLRLPYASLGELFIGREDFLEGIRASVAKAKRAGAWPKQVVHGLGGMGKTRLVVEYAWRYRDEYTAVLLVNGESREALDRDLASLAGVFQLDVDASTPEPRRTQLALDWLKNHPGWLLVVDNVDSEDARGAVAGRLPDWSNGHVLITGRVTRWPRDVEPLDLRVLSAPDATRFLLEATEGGRSVRDDDREQAEALANGELGALCLALEQAAAYINKLELPLADYRARWASNAKDVRRRADKALMRYHEEKDVSLSVATTWQTTVDDLSVGAKAALRMLAWLSPDGIPLAMLEHPSMTEQLDALTGEKNGDVEEALAELRAFSLLSRRQSGRFESAGQVHRLVQLVTRESLSADEKRRTFTAMVAVITAYGRMDEEHFHVSMMEEIPPHLDALISYGEKLGFDKEIAPALREQGNQFHNRGLYASAEESLRRALSIDEAQYGDGHVDVADDLRRLGDVLLELGRNKEAEPHLRRAISISETLCGEEDSRLEPMLNSLCVMLFSDDRLVEAEPIVTRALRINALHHGKDHHSSVEAQLNLAQIFWRTGRLSEAIAVSRGALAIAESHYGADTIETYHSLGLLAKQLIHANELEEAERLIRRLIAIYESSIGDRHPLYADAVTDLGRLFAKQSRWSEAEPIFQQALAISDRTRGETHPEVEFLLGISARVLGELKRPADEEPLLRRLLAIETQNRADRNAAAATTLARLGVCLREQGRLDEAEASFREALSMDEACFGTRHSTVLRDLAGLAFTVEMLERNVEAELLYTRAIDAGDPADESQAASLASSHWGRARVLREMGRAPDAVAPLRSALMLVEQDCGPAHPLVAQSLIDLAQLLEELGHSGEATPLLERSLAIVNGLKADERAKFGFTSAQFALIGGEVAG